MADVDAEDAFEVAAVDDQEPVEALAADGADPPIDEGVRAGCPYRCADRPDGVGAEHLIEGRRELAVAVADQEPDRLRPVDERLDDVPCLPASARDSPGVLSYEGKPRACSRSTSSPSRRSCCSGSFVLFFIELDSRRVHFVGCTANPTGVWVTQQARQFAWTL